MKKLISTLLAIIMVMSVVSVSAQQNTSVSPADEGYTLHPIYEEIFAVNTSSGNVTFSNVTSAVESDGGYYLTVQNPDNTQRGYMELSSLPSSFSLAKYLKLEVKMMVNQADKGIAIAAYSTGGGGTRSNILEFKNDGTVGDKYAPYMVNEWNDIEVYFDLNETRAISYVNGVLAEDIEIPSFKTNGIDNLTNIRFMLLNTGDIGGPISTDTVLSFDDIKVYAVKNTTYNPTFFSDDFTYAACSLNGSLNNAEYGFPAKYGVGVGKRHKVADPENSNDYVLEYASTSDGTAKLYLKKEAVNTNVESCDNVYMSFRFYPKFNVARNIRIYTKGNDRAIGRITAEGVIEFMDVNDNNTYKAVGNCTLNSWNKLIMEFSKKQNDNKYTLTLRLNDQKPLVLNNNNIWGTKDVVSFEINDTTSTAYSTMYIDDIEVGSYTDYYNPGLTENEAVIVGQGTENAVIFTSYEASNGETTVTPIIAAYKNDELVSVNVLDPKDLTAGAVRIKGSVKTGTADEYKVFFLQSKEVINPLDEAISIIK